MRGDWGIVAHCCTLRRLGTVVILSTSSELQHLDRYHRSDSTSSP